MLLLANFVREYIEKPKYLRMQISIISNYLFIFAAEISK